MAQRTIRTDDIDESPDAETIHFSLDGKAYEIDLSATNTGALHDALQPYVDVARRVGGQPRRTTSGSNVDLNAVRTWARENGYEVSDRGRVPANVLEAYRGR